MKYKISQVEQWMSNSKFDMLNFDKFDFFIFRGQSVSNSESLGIENRVWRVFWPKFRKFYLSYLNNAPLFVLNKNIPRAESHHIKPRSHLCHVVPSSERRQEMAFI